MVFYRTIAPVDLTYRQALDERTLCNQTLTQQLKSLQKLCGTFGILPSSFILADAFDGHELTPFAAGGFSRVYRATLEGRPVAVKSLVITADGKGDLKKIHRVCGSVYEHRKRHSLEIQVAC